jgi:hypothetical protein
MKVDMQNSYCSLVRESRDKRVCHESTVVARMRDTLNAQGYHFRRMYPDRHGLTSCKLGLWDKKAGIVLWHERYQIENAATELNRGKVTFQRVSDR